VEWAAGSKVTATCAFELDPQGYDIDYVNARQQVINEVFWYSSCHLLYRFSRLVRFARLAGFSRIFEINDQAASSSDAISSESSLAFGLTIQKRDARL